MKTFVKFLGMMAIGLVAASCGPQQNVESVLADENTRHEVMNKIAEDQDMSMEMMQTMMDNNQGKMMMGGNKEMMKNMMGPMMNMAEKDTAMCRNMMNQMMQNPQMMNMMMEMMHEKGMMDEESMMKGKEMMRGGHMGN